MCAFYINFLIIQTYFRKFQSTLIKEYAIHSLISLITGYSMRTFLNKSNKLMKFFDEHS